MPQAQQIPSRAQVVIIGGGVVGCSVAYHLAKLGWSDIVLLERKQLTCGTTWHAAGLIGQLRATQNLTKLAKYPAELYAGLEAETGVATGYRQVGSRRAPRPMSDWRNSSAAPRWPKLFGLEVEVLSPSKRRSSAADDEGRDRRRLFSAKDGQARTRPTRPGRSPRAREQRGARIFEHAKVTGVLVEKGRGRRRPYRTRRRRAPSTS